MGDFEEYIDDELAANSDDEKRLYKAELRAGKKRKAAEAAKGKLMKGVSAPLGPSRYPRRTVGNVAQLPLQMFPIAVQPGQRMPFAVGPGTTSMLGPCFQCGKMGHFRKACPLLQNLPVGIVSETGAYDCVRVLYCIEVCVPCGLVLKMYLLLCPVADCIVADGGQSASGLGFSQGELTVCDGEGSTEGWAQGRIQGRLSHVRLSVGYPVPVFKANHRSAFMYSEYIRGGSYCPTS